MAIKGIWTENIANSLSAVSAYQNRALSTIVPTCKDFRVEAVFANIRQGSRFNGYCNISIPRIITILMVLCNINSA